MWLTEERRPSREITPDIIIWHTSGYTHEDSISEERQHGTVRASKIGAERDQEQKKSCTGVRSHGG